MSTQPVVKNQGLNKRQIKRIFYRRLGTVIWVSFVMAAIQSMLFFAMFDPEYLWQLSSWEIDVSRMQGYTFGFLFFWVFSFISALLCGIVMVLPRAKLAKRTTVQRDD